MSPPEMHWVLLSRCPSVGHAELLLSALGAHGLGGEIRGRHLTALEASPVEVWVQARNARRANEVLLELTKKDEDPSIVCRECGEESPANFETCWSCGAVLRIDRR
jgi:hypothetical protein